MDFSGIIAFILGLSFVEWFVIFIIPFIFLFMLVGINRKLGDIRKILSEHNDILKQHNKLIEQQNTMIELDNNFKSHKLP